MCVCNDSRGCVVGVKGPNTVAGTETIPTSPPGRMSLTVATISVPSGTSSNTTPLSVGSALVRLTVNRNVALSLESTSENVTLQPSALDPVTKSHVTLPMYESLMFTLADWTLVVAVETRHGTVRNGCVHAATRHTKSFTKIDRACRPPSAIQPY